MVVWTHVDPGSNVHIVFYHKLLHIFCKTQNKYLGQVSGARTKVLGVGDLHVSIGCHSIILHNVLCMQQNPTCTLSTGALKLLDGFILCTSHDALEKLHLVSPHGINQIFSPNTNTMRTFNGLGYIPLVILLPCYRKEPSTVPDPYEDLDGEGYISANAAIALPPRRSTRTRRLPQKFCSSITSSPVPRPPVSVSHRLSSPPPHIAPKSSPLVAVPSILSPKDDSTSIASPYQTKAKLDPISSSPITHINSILAHLKFDCRNMRNIVSMKKNQALKHLPSNPHELHHQCPICAKCKLTRLPRNPPLPVTMLRPGQMLQMDFAFLYVKSVRGFQSYLSCDCVQTKYSFTFCTRIKRSPVNKIRWILFLTLQRMKKTVKNFVRFDEGGELARCEELNKMLIDVFNVVMQTTGGYASHLNGKWCNRMGSQDYQ